MRGRALILAAVVIALAAGIDLLGAVLGLGKTATYLLAIPIAGPVLFFGIPWSDGIPPRPRRLRRHGAVSRGGGAPGRGPARL
jgi:hypothetical protein